MIEHIAIIMDGNGRWATARGLSRSEGHLAGAKQISVVADAARAMGIKSLTLYAFSTENWKRPEPEVTALMSLLKEFATNELPQMMKNNVRLRTIGRTGDLPLASRMALLKAIDLTKNNDGLTINIALSYGGRAEIVDAVNKILKERKSDAPMTEEEFRNYLYLPDMPDPDLMIRTGGNLRISNFLLWQLSYAELYVTETYWPDFGADDLRRAIEAFDGRERRFGGLNEQKDGGAVDK
ncbi:MAG: di-trans,poly-cis-decaprenylcistransferase [Lentisphaerae bacterium]|nr:di-trans,poly-cis-decaprenylcistransferase [Lentisphaerota bacterium]MBQ9803826.1 di-trans,poly-cis-decaprenylcistransferase [Lentisphaeria bacterium]